MSSDTPTHHIWEQQPRESAQSYTLAQCYFAAGPERSLKQVAEQSGKSLGTIYNLSSRHRWRKRARAYDLHIEQIHQQERDKALHQVAGDEAHQWAQRLREGRECEWQVSQELLARVREMLATPTEGVRWTPKDVQTYSQLAALLLRRAAGEVAEPQETAASEDVRVRVEYVSDNEQT